MTHRTAPSLARSPLDAAAGDAALPVWDLSDLYAGPDDPRLAADLDRAEADAKAFETRLAGRLAGLSWYEAAVRANAGAAIKVTRRGPNTAPSAAEIDDLLASVAADG